MFDYNFQIYRKVSFDVILTKSMYSTTRATICNTTLSHHVRLLAACLTEITELTGLQLK